MGRMAITSTLGTQPATESVPGTLSAADKTKLDQSFTSTLALAADETTASNTFASFAVPLKITKTTLAQSVRVTATASGHADSAGGGFTLGIFVDTVLVAGSARSTTVRDLTNGRCAVSVDAVVAVTAASHDFEIKWHRNTPAGGNVFIQPSTIPLDEGAALVVQGVVV